MSEPPTDLEKCLAILVLRRSGCVQDDVASIARCAKSTVGDVERWFSNPRQLPYSEAVKLCDDTAIKRVINIDLVPNEEVDKELLEKLLQITGDDVLRHYRTDYLKRSNLSDPRFLKHTADVLSLLDTYVSQLEVGWEPEDFITPSEGAPPNEQESASWFFAKKAVPSLETQIDSQIDSETLTLAPELEREPEFEALTGHYEGTELWKEIVTYKQTGGKYLGIGIKLHRTILKLIDRVFAEETEAGTFRSALTELIREDLAPVRVKLHLEGTDKTAVLKKLPNADSTSLQQGTELLLRYPSNESRGKVQENGILFADVQNSLTRITEVYKSLIAKQRDILRAVKEEKFKGQLPAGSKCKFCPAA